MMRSETRLEAVPSLSDLNGAVGLKQYEQAISHLLELERMRCGASHRAGLVLLSLYNGNLFKVDLADVCGALDSQYLSAVLTAIAGRHQLLLEPHAVIDNGAQIFEQLVQDYLVDGRP